jgi:hypothetical protein
VYRRMSYTSVEISANLARYQENVVGQVLGHGRGGTIGALQGGGGVHGGVHNVHGETVTSGGGGGGGGGGTGSRYGRPYRVERRDATDCAGWGGVDAKPCFVIALEVLDNLPHDRLCWSAGAPSSSGAAGGGGGGGGGSGGGKDGGGGGGGGRGGGWGGGGGGDGGGGGGGEWMQTRIVVDGGSGTRLISGRTELVETTEPLVDPLLARTVGGCTAVEFH